MPIADKINFNKAKAAYLIVAPLMLVFIYAAFCLFTSETPEDRHVAFYRLLPPHIWGLHMSTLMVLLSVTSLTLATWEKKTRRTRWYKTKSYIQWAIIFSAVSLFVSLLWLLYR